MLPHMGINVIDMDKNLIAADKWPPCMIVDDFVSWLDRRVGGTRITHGSERTSIRNNIQSSRKQPGAAQTAKGPTKY